MQQGDVHKRKIRKNLTIVAMIFLWCALIWAVTMIKIARADEGFMSKRRSAHQEKIGNTQQEWVTDFHEKADARSAAFEKTQVERVSQQSGVITIQGSWEEDWQGKVPARMAVEQARGEAQEKRLEMTQERPRQWWDVWEKHQQEKSEQP